MGRADAKGTPAGAQWAVIARCGLLRECRRGDAADWSTSDELALCTASRVSVLELASKRLFDGFISGEHRRVAAADVDSRWGGGFGCVRIVDPRRSHRLRQPSGEAGRPHTACIVAATDSRKAALWCSVPGVAPSARPSAAAGPRGWEGHPLNVLLGDGEGNAAVAVGGGEGGDGRRRSGAVVVFAGDRGASVAPIHEGGSADGLTRLCESPCTAADVCSVSGGDVAAADGRAWLAAVGTESGSVLVYAPSGGGASSTTCHCVAKADAERAAFGCVSALKIRAACGRARTRSAPRAVLLLLAVGNVVVAAAFEHFAGQRAAKPQAPSVVVGRRPHQRLVTALDVRACGEDGDGAAMRAVSCGDDGALQLWHVQLIVADNGVRVELRPEAAIRGADLHRPLYGVSWSPNALALAVVESETEQLQASGSEHAGESTSVRKFMSVLNRSRALILAPCADGDGAPIGERPDGVLSTLQAFVTHTLEMVDEDPIATWDVQHALLEAVPKRHVHAVAEWLRETVLKLADGADNWPCDDGEKMRVRPLQLALRLVHVSVGATHHRLPQPDALRERVAAQLRARLGVDVARALDSLDDRRWSSMRDEELFSARCWTHEAQVFCDRWLAGGTALARDLGGTCERVWRRIARHTLRRGGKSGAEWAPGCDACGAAVGDHLAEVCANASSPHPVRRCMRTLLPLRTSIPIVCVVCGGALEPPPANCPAEPAHGDERHGGEHTQTFEWLPFVDSWCEMCARPLHYRPGLSV